MSGKQTADTWTPSWSETPKDLFLCVGVCFSDCDDNISERIVKPDELETFPRGNQFKMGLIMI